MIGELILTFFMFRYLRKYLRNSNQPLVWDRVFIGGMVASVVLILLDAGFDSIGVVIQWIAFLFMGFIVYVIYSRNEFKLEKSVLPAVLPYMIMSLLSKVVNWVNSDFYASWESYFDAGNGFSLIWMIVMLIIINNQNKALAREREKRQQEEEQNKVTAQLKAELEVQVKERTAELTEQKEELLQALNELKNTQTQLIHSEKMASLGELTAGIAHEIQNPLNFVNNFSDINRELIEEMLDEMKQGNEEEVEAIAKDLIDNEAKITHHGKRAEEIVKSMLQHSRGSEGVKELTDLNMIADEYLRLAYHGLRAKDPSFNCDYSMELDPDLPRLEVVPQDIGRVLLNLINNAFQAVAGLSNEGAGKTPEVKLSTKRVKKEVHITISDNGPGIPDDIKDKIYQPFFTTKETGQGTGLGLSLSYDIVTKGHGGKLDLRDHAGGGAEFVIRLPLG